MKILLNFIFLLILCSSFSQAKEKEKNFFCTEDFRFGKIYSLELLKQKLSEGLNVNDKCTYRNGSNGLDYILMKITKPEALKILEQAGADFDTRRKLHDGVTGNTLLHVAAQGELPETINYLVKKGYNINAKNAFGETPMSYACRYANVHILKTLVRNGANYKYKSYNNKKNISCLIDATLYHNNYESIKYLYTLDTPKDLPNCTHKRSNRECSLFSRIYLDSIWISPETYDRKVLEFLKKNGENFDEYFVKDSFKNVYTTIFNELLRNRPNPIIVKIADDLIKLGVDVNKPEIYKDKDIKRIESSPIFGVFLVPANLGKFNFESTINLINFTHKIWC